MAPSQYDISLAVQAIRTLFSEMHSNEDCSQFVWKPIQFWLQRLTEENPPTLTCFHENLLPDEESGGHRCDAYLVVPGNKIIYLGTIQSRKEAESQNRWLKETFPERDKDLANQFAMVRWWNMCRIPVDAEPLTLETIESGVRMYLQELAPALCQTPIVWLPEEKRRDLSFQINYQAKVTAKRQSDEEKIEIIADDL